MSIWSRITGKAKLERQIKQIEKTNLQLARKVGASFGYGYGGYGVSGSDGSKYDNGINRSGQPVFLDHYTLRQNARRAEQDTPQVKSLIDRFADTVVDVGLKLQPAPKFDMLGITREQAEEWAENVADRFDSWARSKKSDRSETNNFYQNQRMYQRFQQRDNDMFVRLYYSNRRDLMNPLQISFVDPDQIRGDAFTSTGGYVSTSDDGIERNSKGVETGYKIWSIVDGNYKLANIPAKGIKSGRRMMLHGYNPEYAGQGRGYSRFAHALQEFQKLTDFSLSHIQKAIAQASMALFVEPSDDADSSDPFEGLGTNSGAGPTAYTAGADPQPDNSVQVDSQNNYETCPVPELTNRAPGAAFLTNLAKGETIKEIGNTAPVANYEKFVDSFVSHLTASVGMPESLARIRFGQSFSAQRGELMVFWRIAQIWINEMASDFMDPCYESWLSEEIAAGRISAPGWSDPRMKAAWLSNRWIGAPMPNIDPAKTARADKAYAEMGAQTLDDIARNVNGSSGKANRAKLTREFQELPLWPTVPENV